MREWNASHGGVYAPVTATTQPNPWLDVPERDVTTTTGRRLTLLNPAYMTRQIAEITAQRRGIGIHLTSLTRCGRGTRPTPWEREALGGLRARGGGVAWSSPPTPAGSEIFRYIGTAARRGAPASPATPGRGTASARSAAASRSPSPRTCSAAPARPSTAASCSRAPSSGSSARRSSARWRPPTTSRSRIAARLRELALVDELTGLHNRRGFFLLAEKQLQIARRTGRPDLLLFVDLDGMKDDQRPARARGRRRGAAADRRGAPRLLPLLGHPRPLRRRRVRRALPEHRPRVRAEPGGGARAARRGRQRGRRGALAPLAELGDGGVRPGRAP